jgi:microcystin-dependent protein
MGYSSSGQGESGANFPAGVIVWWHGSIATIPAGWALCDGQNGTPDLRDKFIVGARQDGAGVAKTNLTGALTQSGGNANHTHAVAGNTGGTTSGYSTSTLPVGTTIPAYAHTHSLNITSGNNSTVPVPYYALAFIMKL